MALALYRKYRPRTFAEVIGQEHVTEPLSQALRTGRLNHAYLFSGPRGCGKTSSARILARSLNCAEGPTPEPCGRCDSCVSLVNDGTGSIDVIEIDAASHGGVDDARELRERAFFAPVSSRYKIYVIDEAHMVSSAGFNALLKLVEEPPDYVKFIFATTEPEKVLGTIKSRTHHYPFRLIPPGVLRPYLEQLCQEEGVTVEPAVFPLVVRAGGGSARDSLSVLDQLISGAGPEGVGYARAVALLGVTDAALIDEMCDALAAGDGATAFATIDRVAEAGHDPRRFASDLLERMRDLIVLQQVPDAVTKGLLDAPADQLARMESQAQRMGQATLSRCADIVHNGLVEMRGTTAPRLLLELICARMLLPGADDTTGGLLQRLERMERRLTLSGDPAPLTAAAGAGDSGVRPQPVPAAAGSPPPSGPSPRSSAAGSPPTGPSSSGPSSGPSLPGSSSGAPVSSSAVDPSREPARGDAAVPPVQPGSAAPQQSAVSQVSAVQQAPAARPESAASAGGGGRTAAPGVLDAAAVRRVWDQILALVNDRKKVVAAWAREATVQDLDGETLVLLFRYPFHAQKLSAQPESLVEALCEVLGGRWQLRCEVVGEQRSPDAGGARQGVAGAESLAGVAGGRGVAPGAGGSGTAPGAGAAGVAPGVGDSGAADPVSRAADGDAGRHSAMDGAPGGSAPMTSAGADAGPLLAAPPGGTAGGSAPARSGGMSTATATEAGTPAMPGMRTTPGTPGPSSMAGLSSVAVASSGAESAGSDWPEIAQPGGGGSGDVSGSPAPVAEAMPTVEGGSSGNATAIGVVTTPGTAASGTAVQMSPHTAPGLAGQGLAGQGRAGQGQVGQGYPGPEHAGQAQAGQAYAGQAQAGQGHAAGQGLAGQGYVGQGQAGWDQAGQGPVGQGYPVHDEGGRGQTLDGPALGQAAADQVTSDYSTIGHSAPAQGVGQPSVGQSAANPSTVDQVSPAASADSRGAAGANNAASGNRAAGNAPGNSAGTGLGGSTANGVGNRTGSNGPGNAASSNGPSGPGNGPGNGSGGGVGGRAGEAPGNGVVRGGPGRGASAARQAARDAASGRGGAGANRARGSGRAGGGRTAGAVAEGGRRGADPSDSGAWAGEPPYDPEYDGPVRGTAAYEGFDPGDEPLDEVVDEQTARQTSEQQALQLLQQALGAEKIGEVDPR